jgi:hypothetical protein
LKLSKTQLDRQAMIGETITTQLEAVKAALAAQEKEVARAYADFAKCACHKERVTVELATATTRSNLDLLNHHYRVKSGAAAGDDVDDEDDDVASDSSSVAGSSSTAAARL